MVYNFGIFDMHGLIVPRKDIHYGFWSRMIERCHSPKSLIRYPQYANVTICSEWKLFSNFRLWSINNYIDGYVLDKDIAYPDKNIYSPETCAYVPQELNKSILDSKSARNDLALGVWYKQKSNKMINERSKPYIAEINNTKIGSFLTKEEAHKAWQSAKILQLEMLANKYLNKVDDKVISGLLKRADVIRYQFDNNLITNEVSKMELNL